MERLCLIMESLSDDQGYYNIGLLKPFLFPNYSVLYGAATFLLHSPQTKTNQKTKHIIHPEFRIWVGEIVQGVNCLTSNCGAMTLVLISAPPMVS